MLATYNTLPDRQHKCIAHHLKAISEASEAAQGAAHDYLQQWKLLFQTVLAVHSLAVQHKTQIRLSFGSRLQLWCQRLPDQPRPIPALCRFINV